MNRVFDKNLILSLAEPISDDYISSIYDYVCNSLDTVFENLNKIRPIILDYRYEIVNECKNFAEGQNSTLDIMVELQSPSLELSCYNLNKSSIKKFLLRFANAWKASSKKKNKKKKKESQKNNTISTSNNYNMLSFKNEVMYGLTNFFTNETMLSIGDNSILIFSKDEIGFNIKLYFVFGTEDEYKLFNTSNYKLTKINFKYRDVNFRSKLDRTGNNLTSILRILNELYFQLYKKHINQLLLESVLFNIPDEIYQDENIYNVFIKIVNYINFSLTSIIDYKSILDEENTIANDELVKIDLGNFINFIKRLTILI